MKINKFTRIVALLGVIILLLMIIATFVVAVVNFDGSERIFKGLLISDFVVPVILWSYLMIYRWAKGRDDRLKDMTEAELNKMDNNIDN